ncbi:MAG: DUF3168 domain-containing protein [Sulfurimonas sp.]|nr:DUF3168 domain-containing protein [Sulfurimonas sp.]PHQ90107.1 MAG: hypothetical protein COB42_05690 [Sulfurimonas sp.]
MIEKEVYTALKTVCSRVYPLFMPDDAVFPSITYQVVFEGTEQGLAGCASGTSTRYQVDIYSKTYSEAKTLKGETVLKLLELNAGNISAQDLFEDTIKLHRQLINFNIKE